MRRLTMGIILITVLASLAGCFFVDRDGRRDGRDGYERHEEHHEERR